MQMSVWRVRQWYLESQSQDWQGRASIELYSSRGGSGGTASKTREPDLVRLLLQASFYSPKLLTEPQSFSLHCIAFMYWWVLECNCKFIPPRTVLSARQFTGAQRAPEKCKVEKSLEPSDKGSSCKVSLPKFPEIISCKVAFWISHTARYVRTFFAWCTRNGIIFTINTHTLFF